MKRSGTLVVVLAFGSVLSILAQQRQLPSAAVAIKAGRLIYGNGAPPIENAVVIVVGERIDAVGPASSIAIPQNARVVDLSADTVLPGLINGHDHPAQRAFTGRELDREGANSLLQQFEQKREPLPIQTARAVRNVRADLMAGITTEYVVGAVQFLDVQLRKMINAGVVPGPRLYPSGSWVIPTAGYSPVVQVNGPWAIRGYIRNNVESGAHHIKLVMARSMVSGPSVGRPFGATSTNWTNEEILAAVDEAHRLGVKVTVHATDAISIKQALEAGVDSVQHASTLTPEILALFHKTGAGIVNTYVTGFQRYFTPNDYLYLDTQANTPEEWLNYARQILERALHDGQRSGDGRAAEQRLRQRYDSLEAAKNLGIPIAVGTDNMQALLNLELENLVKAGFSPLEAISSATGVGAKALGVDQDVGTLQKGKYADIISARGRPDQNIRDLDKIHFVMVGGHDYTGLSFR